MNFITIKGFVYDGTYIEAGTVIRNVSDATGKKLTVLGLARRADEAEDDKKPVKKQTKKGGGDGETTENGNQGTEGLPEDQPQL